MEARMKSSKKVIWQPQPKQRILMERPEYEALYGGAAGGGKSDCMLAEALRQVHIPHYRALIFRKTYPQLSELIDRSRDLYKPAYPRAKYNETEHFWRFPSGAKVIFGSMQYTKDRTNYQGKHYDLIIFDELTHFTWEEYSYMLSRNRPSGPGTRVYMRATANPGGVGHSWVKERFVTAAPPMTTIRRKLSIVDPNGKPINRIRSRIFVPSTVFDNQALMKNDPDYIANLAMLPEAEQQALLYGNWDSFSGQVFTEWRNDPAGYHTQRYTHVINDFLIPPTWKIYRGFDFGYAKPFSVGWHAVDHDGCIYRIKEWYGCTKEPNTGIKITAQEMAQGIKEIEASDPNLKGRRVVGIADPSIWDSSRGESIAEMMERCSVYFEPGDNTRLAGKMQYHYRFAFDEEGDCMFQVFNTCTNFIRTIPNLVYSDKHPEDIDTDLEDHIYDECRYVLMENPISPRMNIAQRIKLDDPLNQRTEPTKPYRFYSI